MKPMKIVVEKHPDGYVAYPLGFKGVVVGEGDSYEEALKDCRSAIRCHQETFGPESLERASQFPERLDRVVPKGLRDNSPRFQPWVCRNRTP